jgi:hypothetical protein
MQTIGAKLGEARASAASRYQELVIRAIHALAAQSAKESDIDAHSLRSELNDRKDQIVALIKLSIALVAAIMLVSIALNIFASTSQIAAFSITKLGSLASFFAGHTYSLGILATVLCTASVLFVSTDIAKLAVQIKSKSPDESLYQLLLDAENAATPQSTPDLTPSGTPVPWQSPEETDASFKTAQGSTLFAIAEEHTGDRESPSSANSWEAVDSQDTSSPRPTLRS